MKSILLIIAAFTISACANKAKMEDKKAEVKKEATKAATTEMKKAETKVEAKKETAMSDSIIKKFTCSAAKDERLINVEKTAEGGCKVLYTKFGDTKVIATAVKDISYCEGVGEKVSTNLQKAGFSCN